MLVLKETKEIIQSLLSIFDSQQDFYKSAEPLIKKITEINFPLNEEEKRELLSLTKKYLSKLNSAQIEELAGKIFQIKVYNGNDNFETLGHRENLQSGVKIFNSINVELAELLYIVSGTNLNQYKDFIDSLVALKEEDFNNINVGQAIISESDKQKILQIINASHILSNIMKNPPKLIREENDIVATKDLALQRFCFLAANKENLKITEESEARILLTFVNIGNNFKVYKYDIYINFAKYLVKECKTHEKVKQVLNIYGDKISQFVESEPNLISNLNNLADYFKYELENDIDILTIELEKLLDPNLQDVLPKTVFLNSINDKKEEKINPVKEVVDNPEVKNLNNINDLCNRVDKLLNISPLVSLFEEYNNHQTLESEVNNVQKILGDIE